MIEDNISYKRLLNRFFDTHAIVIAIIQIIVWIMAKNNVDVGVRWEFWTTLMPFWFGYGVFILSYGISSIIEIIKTASEKGEL